jgi:hypothetical protein
MAKFGRSLAVMTSYFSTMKLGESKSQKLTIATVESSMLCSNREKLVTQALRGDASHVLFLDCDMQFPPDTAHRLLLWEKDFICAAYPTKSEPATSVAIDLEGKKVRSTAKWGVQKIQHGGLGVCLINTECIKRLTPPLFLMDWIPGDIQNYCGEDVYFSQKMADIGVDLWVDHDLSNEIGHVGFKTYTFDDVKSETLKDHKDMEK